jgi:hypothetical protein
MSRIYTSSPPQAPPWRVEGLLYFFFTAIESKIRSNDPSYGRVSYFIILFALYPKDKTFLVKTIFPPVLFASPCGPTSQ